MKKLIKNLGRLFEGKVTKVAREIEYDKKLTRVLNRAVAHADGSEKGDRVREITSILAKSYRFKPEAYLSRHFSLSL